MAKNACSPTPLCAEDMLHVEEDREQHLNTIDSSRGDLEQHYSLGNHKSDDVGIEADAAQNLEIAHPSSQSQAVLSQCGLHSAGNFNFQNDGLISTNGISKANEIISFKDSRLGTKPCPDDVSPALSLFDNDMTFKSVNLLSENLGEDIVASMREGPVDSDHIPLSCPVLGRQENDLLSDAEKSFLVFLDDMRCLTTRDEESANFDHHRFISQNLRQPCVSADEPISAALKKSPISDSLVVVQNVLPDSQEYQQHAQLEEGETVCTEEPETLKEAEVCTDPVLLSSNRVEDQKDVGQESQGQNDDSISTPHHGNNDQMESRDISEEDTETEERQMDNIPCISTGELTDLAVPPIVDGQSLGIITDSFAGGTDECRHMSVEDQEQAVTPEYNGFGDTVDSNSGRENDPVGNTLRGLYNNVTITSLDQSVFPLKPTDEEAETKCSPHDKVEALSSAVPDPQLTLQFIKQSDNIDDDSPHDVTQASGSTGLNADCLLLAECNAQGGDAESMSHMNNFSGNPKSKCIYIDDQVVLSERHTHTEHLETTCQIPPSPVDPLPGFEGNQTENSCDRKADTSCDLAEMVDIHRERLITTDHVSPSSAFPLPCFEGQHDEQLYDVRKANTSDDLAEMVDGHTDTHIERLITTYQVSPPSAFPLSCFEGQNDEQLYDRKATSLDTRGDLSEMADELHKARSPLWGFCLDPPTSNELAVPALTSHFHEKQNPDNSMAVTESEYHLPSSVSEQSLPRVEMYLGMRDPCTSQRGEEGPDRDDVNREESLVPDQLSDLHEMHQVELTEEGSFYDDAQGQEKDCSLPSANFKWKYRPSCEADEEVLATHPDDDQVLGTIQPLMTQLCNRSLRLGLSRRQRVKRLHKM